MINKNIKYEKRRMKITRINDEIEKQIKIYNNDLKKISEINKILNKLNCFINN